MQARAYCHVDHTQRSVCGALGHIEAVCPARDRRTHALVPQSSYCEGREERVVSVSARAVRATPQVTPYLYNSCRRTP